MPPTTPRARPARDRVLGRVADQVCAAWLGHPVRVAIDGITATGKSTFAAELADAARRRGRPAIHLSCDGFHHPRERRYRQGRTSAAGYYRDAYDVHSLVDAVLEPLGSDGDRRYREQVHDLANDRPVRQPERTAADDAVVLIDGTFLQRPELAGWWDEVVFVDTAFEIARDRGTHRDAALFGGLDAARDAFDQRYHAACRLYVQDVDPAQTATIVVGNDDVDHPVLRRVGGKAGTEVALFSYGTLQQTQVQLATFGRELAAVVDSLAGYRTGWVTITDPDVIAVSGSDRHPVVRRSSDPADTVPGRVLTLATGELAAADTYEMDDYRRRLVRLHSGRAAWVYLAAAADPPQR